MKNRVIVFAVILAAIATAEVGVFVDFGKVVAPFRPALHSAGFSPWYRHAPAVTNRKYTLIPENPG